MSGSSPAMPAR